MGTYLSTPIVEKGEDSGEALDCSVTPLAWGVVDMQGWRKTMEDAHLAQTDIAVPSHVYMDEDSRTKGSDAKLFGVFDGHGGPEVARFCQLYMVDVLTKQPTWVEESPEKEDPNDPSSSAVGQTLVATFHALDRMIDDKTRRDELTLLRTEKPSTSERRTTDGHPIPAPVNEHLYMAADDSKPPAVTNPENSVTVTAEASEESNPEEDDDAKPPTDEENTGDKEQAAGQINEEIKTRDDGEGDDADDKDDDSLQAVGQEEAAELDRDMLETGNEENVSEEEASTDNQVAGVIEEALQGANGGEEKVVVVNMTPDEQKDATNDTAETPATAAAAAASSVPLPQVTATIVQNGRKICNLPDHPVHAGCTAVVAVLIGKTLTVANAGDSRAVLCRSGGRAEALSFDHKPHQEREMRRITGAGGFVNQFGRVNGNLNLSRSIGDLKYKQIPGLSPAEQMITADPDILQVTLDPRDEFFILGCDGIWDCLTNDDAVKYVRERIDSRTPIQIGAEMLDEILSEDPRATQGIGGDNMTVMIVDLQPSKRAYR